jgi:hypothetical protein
MALRYTEHMQQRAGAHLAGGLSRRGRRRPAGIRSGAQRAEGDAGAVVRCRSDAAVRIGPLLAGRRRAGTRRTRPGRRPQRARSPRCAVRGVPFTVAGGEDSSGSPSSPRGGDAVGQPRHRRQGALPVARRPAPAAGQHPTRGPRGGGGGGPGSQGWGCQPFWPACASYAEVRSSLDRPCHSTAGCHSEPMSAGWSGHMSRYTATGLCPSVTVSATSSRYGADTNRSRPS